ncbi:hypothetical protein UFOVP787_67 [uncultured Caudovirales phage]|uniref:Uncharacterized protein n=1 Tax=uncultured Caudovirales phage TaxID=2100421 RepID=A0A6J5NUE3_9CAUD|nr:hypothetical protein UFOVP787_67 [uncultured Caudovirales phage]
MMMVLDDRTFEQTAEAVHILNPYINGKYPTVTDLLTYMKSCAQLYMYDSTSFSTAGFDLTAFISSDKENRVVRASVSAYTALSYLKGTRHPI